MQYRHSITTTTERFTGITYLLPQTENCSKCSNTPAQFLSNSIRGNTYENDGENPPGIFSRLNKLNRPRYLDNLQALEIALFNLYWPQLVVETMPAFWIAEHLDVIEHIRASILPGAVDLSPDPLPLQQLERDFRYRIVMAVTTSARAAKQVTGFQETLSVAAAELTTLVLVNHDLLLRLTPPNRSQQCINSLVAGHLRFH